MAFIVVGDSNATGAGVRPDLTWPMMLSAHRQERLHLFATPGGTLSFDIGTIAPLVLAALYEPFHDHSVVIVAIGGNDALVPWQLPLATTHLTAILRAIPSVPKLCVVPCPTAMPVPFPFNAANLEATRVMVRTTAAAQGVPILETSSLIVPPGDVLADGGHLSVQGHHKMFDALRVILPPPITQT